MAARNALITSSASKGYGEPTTGIGTEAALTALKPTPYAPLGFGMPVAGIGTEDALTVLKPTPSAPLGEGKPAAITYKVDGSPARPPECISLPTVAGMVGGSSAQPLECIPPREFGEKPTTATLDENSGRVHRDQVDQHTMEPTCVGVIKSMIELIGAYLLSNGGTYSFPMAIASASALLGNNAPVTGIGTVEPLAALDTMASVVMGDFKPAAGIGTVEPLAALEATASAAVGDFKPAVGVGTVDLPAALESMASAVVVDITPATGIGTMDLLASLEATASAGSERTLRVQRMRRAHGGGETDKAGVRSGLKSGALPQGLRDGARGEANRSSTMGLDAASGTNWQRRAGGGRVGSLANPGRKSRIKARVAGRQHGGSCGVIVKDAEDQG